MGKFNNLTKTQQQHIIEFNRIILEFLYPTICPRNSYFAFFGDTLVKGLRKEQSRDPIAKKYSTTYSSPAFLKSSLPPDSFHKFLGGHHRSLQREDLLCQHTMYVFILVGASIGDDKKLVVQVSSPTYGGKDYAA
jgi:hypothetical protein